MQCHRKVTSSGNFWCKQRERKCSFLCVQFEMESLIYGSNWFYLSFVVIDAISEHQFYLLQSLNVNFLNVLYACFFSLRFNFVMHDFD